MAQGSYDRAILVCGTGVGMALTANRYRGVRAANCHDSFSARYSRSHNDANVLTLGGRVVGVGLAWEIVNVWLETAFSKGDRHMRRIAKIDP
jgi:ribose 5-phosphate isomerase B